MKHVNKRKPIKSVGKRSDRQTVVGNIAEVKEVFKKEEQIIEKENKVEAVQTKPTKIAPKKDNIGQ